MKFIIFVIIFSWFAQMARGQESTNRGAVGAPSAQPVQQTTVSASPSLIRYNGVLSGYPLQTVNITFGIYKDEKGGQPLWQESQNIELDGAGHYSALLGFASPDGVPPSIFASSEAQWLGIRANAGQELPRALLVSVPYAMKAQTADTLGGLQASDFVLRSEFQQQLQTLERLAIPTTATPATFGQVSPRSVAQATILNTSTETPLTEYAANNSTEVFLLHQLGSGYGLEAINTNPTNPGYAVYAATFGVNGVGSRSEALATSGNGIGGWGVSVSDKGTGLLGEATSISGPTYAVRGSNRSESGTGVLGLSISSSGTTTGVRGETRSPAGTAGVFDAFPGGNILSGRSAGVEKFKLDSAGKMTTSGGVAAASFTGDGSNLTNVNAAFLNGFPASTFFNADVATFQKLDSTQLQINSQPDAANQFGYAGFIRDDLDSVKSVIGQAGTQTHFRLSRATPDDNFAKDFLIVPYSFGMAFEYAGTLEMWSRNFSVHVPRLNPPPTEGAMFWVGDQYDTGGLFVTANQKSMQDPGDVVLAADKFSHQSHGSMNFITRSQGDGFRFLNGPWNFEKTQAQLFTTQSTSNFEIDSGSIAGTLVADATQGVVQIGSRTNNRVDIITGDSSPKLSVFPNGDVSIGSTSDIASFAVGSSGQFQISSLGAVTIGGGTPIVQHISTTADVTVTSLPPASCTVITAAASGASDGDTVAIGAPNALASAGDLILFGWVSASNIVSIRSCNMGAASIDSAFGSVRIDVWKH